jgi:hypothetical protein
VRTLVLDVKTRQLRLEIKMTQAEAQHRDHAIVEQVFADLISGPLAHLPYVD